MSEDHHGITISLHEITESRSECVTAIREIQQLEFEPLDIGYSAPLAGFKLHASRFRAQALRLRHQGPTPVRLPRQFSFSPSCTGGDRLISRPLRCLASQKGCVHVTLVSTLFSCLIRAGFFLCADQSSEIGWASRVAI